MPSSSKSGADYNRDEELWARRHGCELVKNSGRGERKGDARKGEYLLDLKFTAAGSYSLNMKKYREFEKQAFVEGRSPIVIAVFEDGTSIAMLDWEQLDSIIEKAEKYDSLCE